MIVDHSTGHGGHQEMDVVVTDHSREDRLAEDGKRSRELLPEFQRQRRRKYLRLAKVEWSVPIHWWC